MLLNSICITCYYILLKYNLNRRFQFQHVPRIMIFYCIRIVKYLDTFIYVLNAISQQLFIDTLNTISIHFTTIKSYLKHII